MKIFNIWGTHHNIEEIQKEEIKQIFEETKKYYEKNYSTTVENEFEIIKFPFELQEKFSYIKAENEEDLNNLAIELIHYFNDFPKSSVINIFQLAGTVDFFLVLGKKCEYNFYINHFERDYNIYLYTSLNECKREEINNDNGLKINKTFFKHKKFRKVVLFESELNVY